MPAAWTRLALAAVGAALGVHAVWLAIERPEELTRPAFVHVAIGWSFVAAGAIGWRLRPENRMGLLMMLAGIVWFGRDLDAWDGAVAQHAADLSQNVFLALTAHQVIVFPYGVARTTVERGLVATAYALAFGGYLLSELVPATDDPLAAAAIPILLLIVLVVVRRWQTATEPGRRALAPLLWVGPPVLVVAALSIAVDYLDVSLSSTGESLLDWATLVYAGIPLAFLFGLLRTHLHRATVGRLVVELGDVGSATEVRDALARSLGDPTLELAFWLRGDLVGLDGRPSQLEPSDGRAVTVVSTHGERVAALRYDSSLLEEPALVEEAGAAAALALDNARLQTELRVEIARRGGSDVTADGPLAALTARELEVLSLLAEGRTDRGIAQELYVTPKTVEAHVRSIFRKLDLPAESSENRRVHAVLTFLRAQAS